MPANDDLDRFIDALLKLPEPQQSIAALRLLDELTYREIAEIMELPLQDVTRICAEAMEQLRDIL